jgi:hypothetical protein
MMKYLAAMSILINASPALGCGPFVPPWECGPPPMMGQQQMLAPIEEVTANQPCFIVPSAGEPEVNLRSKPQGKIIGQLVPGARARIQEVKPPWAFVSTWTPNGYLPSGWVWVRNIDPRCVPPAEIEAGEPPHEPPLK